MLRISYFFPENGVIGSCAAEPYGMIDNTVCIGLPDGSKFILRIGNAK
jgi:hypothetical protein